MNLLNIGVDHVGFLGRELYEMQHVMEDLGFATGGPCALNSGLCGQKTNQNAHFVLDNAYIECIASTQGDHLQSYLRPKTGVHILALGSEALSCDLQRVSQVVPTTDTVCSQRPANHGRLQGQAQFEWAGIEYSSTADTLMGLVHHQTPQLIYQPDRIKHPNGTVEITKIYVAESSETDRCLRRLQGQIDTPAHHITQVFSVSPHEVLTQFGTVPNSVQSDILGLCFNCEDVQELEVSLRQKQIPVIIHGDQVVVNLYGTLGVFFAFTQK